MPCRVELDNKINQIIANKPYYRYKNSFIEVIYKPNSKIDTSQKAFGVAKALANKLNKEINNGINIGQVFYPIGGNTPGVDVKPTDNQLNRLNDYEFHSREALKRVRFEEELNLQENIRYQTSISQAESLQEGLEWAKKTFPNFTPELQKGLIQGIARGSFNTLTDVITFSEEFANKGTVKHEFGHLVFKYLPKEQQEALLNEGSKLFNIPRGESKATVKYSKEQENQVNYLLKAVDILQSQKAIDTFNKAKKANWDLNKILTELQIPKEQKELILNFNKTNREDIITDLVANYSFTIEINTAKSEYGQSYDTEIGEVGSSYNTETYDRFYIGEDYYTKIDTYRKNGEKISASDYDKAIEEYKEKQPKLLVPTQYYANLTVPGGINYTENEIATPLITPSIKGHAQFSTDNGIGWFRSDDQVLGGEFNEGFIYEEGDNYEDLRTPFKETKGGISTKTRRILELQSDLFQKGRDKEDLTKPYKTITKTPEIGFGEYGEPVTEEFRTDEDISKNKFLQLLNKNNNWVTFFVKAIIQDSAKKGYEKVLFPTGNTASKVEGHETLEEFKRQKEERLNHLNIIIDNLSKEDSIFESPDGFNVKLNEYNSVGPFNSKEDAEHERNKIIGNTDYEIQQLQEELKRVETEGFAALRPIFNFYQNTVANILKKQGYNPNVITDEYGNTWNEVVIKPEFLENIKLQSPKVEYTGDLAIEEKIMEKLEKSPDSFNKNSIIGRFLQKLKDFLRKIYDKRGEIQKFIDSINEGKYAEIDNDIQNLYDLAYNIPQEKVLERIEKCK